MRGVDLSDLQGRKLFPRGTPDASTMMKFLKPAEGKGQKNARPEGDASTSEEGSSKKLRTEDAAAAASSATPAAASSATPTAATSATPVAATLAPAVSALLEELTDPEWRAALKRECGKAYVAKMAEQLAAEQQKHTVFPPPGQIFTAFNAVPLSKVRVVIIGQDPYHGPGQAHGLCFSVLRGVQTPPSLKNIYKELVDDVEGFQTPSHGNLQSWADQGVFMLNATMTVRKANANSHQKFGWQEFTDAVIKLINEQTRGRHVHRHVVLAGCGRAGHLRLGPPSPSPSHAAALRAPERSCRAAVQPWHLSVGGAGKRAGSTAPWPRRRSSLHVTQLSPLLATQEGRGVHPVGRLRTEEGQGHQPEPPLRHRGRPPLAAVGHQVPRLQGPQRIDQDTSLHLSMP